MEKKTQVIEPYQLHYSDLISLSSSSSPSSSTEIRRLESVTRSILDALGPAGPGLLTITGVPNAAENRDSLLPLARDLSLLPHLHRKRILKDHGLGSDVPLKNLDRCVSSFAMQLKYGHDVDSGKLSHLISYKSLDKDNTNLSYLSFEGLDKHNLVGENFDACEYNKSMDDHFKDLGHNFRNLGLCMMDLGLRVARICDRVIGGKELENSLLESRTAKGRLIHYHSSLDTYIIKEVGQRKGSKKSQQKSKNMSCRIGEMHRDGDDGRGCEKSSDLWQQWHYDYGTFTVLTSPMYIRPTCCKIERGDDVCANSGGLECLSQSENTYLQIFYPKRNNVCTIKAPPESFILQVGESADILSRKKLQATLHSVSRPVELESLSRETFVVFLHPAWNKVFDISDYPLEHLTLNNQSEKYGERPQSNEELNNLTHGINKIIPPLSARLKDGMTFAEFSRETTKQYYGGNGLQSNR
ncbi:Flavonol synthase/flavanone 3-hydroxylase [Bienertia sinuspersici]